MAITIIAGADIARTPKVEASVPQEIALPTPTNLRSGVLTATTAPVVITEGPVVENSVEDIIGSVFDNKEEALKVAFCESSLNPKVTHKNSTATGLFQILKGTWKQFKCTGEPLNALDNTKCAKKIYDYYGSWNTRGGWAASYWCHLLN
jgi:hypothetical protein